MYQNVFLGKTVTSSDTHMFFQTRHSGSLFQKQFKIMAMNKSRAYTGISFLILQSVSVSFPSTLHSFSQ